MTQKKKATQKKGKDVAEMTKQDLRLEAAAIGADENLSKSDRIRTIYDMGFEVKEVADMIGIRRQFVDNVIRQRDGEVRKTKSVNQSQKFRDLFEDGMTVAEIAKAENANYNWVYAVIKKHKKTQK